MKRTKPQPTLPIGRAARIAFEIDEARAGCCQAARALLGDKHVNETELEDCARLDDALAQAQRLIKLAVSKIMLSRIDRGSRGTKTT